MTSSGYNECDASSPNAASVTSESYIRALAVAVVPFSFCMMSDNLIFHYQVFLLLGNGKANQFWGANIPPSESLCVNANSEQRLQHITAKYKDGKYRKYHILFGQQEALNKVSQSDLNAK